MLNKNNYVFDLHRNINSQFSHDNYLLSAKQKLEKYGAVVINKDMVPWSIEELDYIGNSTSPEKIAYLRATHGDTNESTYVSYVRILHPTIECQKIHKILQLVDSIRVKKYLLSLTGLQDYQIDRCQAHMYGKGDFINSHNDKRSCPSYDFTIILLLSDGYIGGEFNVYANEILLTLKPLKYSLIIAKSKYDHEVKKVISGVRRTLVFFLKVS